MGTEIQNIPALKPGLDIALPGDPQPLVDETARKLYDEASSAVLKVVTDKARTGSGFLVEDGTKLITTARNLIGTKEQFVVGPDGKRYKAEIETMDDINDLATLKIKQGKIAGTTTLKLGDSTGLEEDMKTFSLMVPKGETVPYISPGYAREISSPIKFLAGMDPQILMKLRMGGMTMDMQGKVEAQGLLGRPLLETQTHMQVGGGGGPMLNADGKVIGVLQVTSAANITAGKTLSSPAEAATNLLEKKGRFDFTYKASAEPWAEALKEQYNDSKVATAGSGLVAGGLAYAGYLGLNKFPVIGGSALAAWGVSKLSNDATKLLSSTDSNETLKYGLATAADLGTASGAVMSMLPKVRGYGLALAGAGLVGRAATDFIQTHWQVDTMKRKEGHGHADRPPVSFDKLLGQ